MDKLILFCFGMVAGYYLRFFIETVIRRQARRQQWMPTNRRKYL